MAPAAPQPTAGQAAVAPLASAGTQTAAVPGPAVHEADESESEHYADSPTESAEFMLKQRWDGPGELPVERYVDAMRQMRGMRRINLREGRFLEEVSPAAAATFGNWEALGPGNVGGRTRAVIIHPQDANTMWAGGATGGIWKTTDGGQTWIPQSDFAPVLTLNTMAMDPNDPNTLYAGTGEESQGWRGAGIFKTGNGGQNWNQLPSTATSDFFYVNKIAVGANSANVYAATSTGLWISADAGNTWNRSLGPTTLSSTTGATNCFDLAIAPGPTTDEIFAVCQPYNSTTGTSSFYAIYRNLERGTWVQVHSDPQMAATALAIAPSQPTTINAVSSYPALVPPTGYSSALLAVYRSTSNGDAGTWVTRTSNTDPSKLNTAILSSDPAYGLASFCANSKPSYTGQGSYNLFAAVDPLDANRLWVGGIGLFRSDDGGANWGYAQSGNHPDQHFLAFPPGYDGAANQTLISGNDGGVYRTVQARGVTATCQAAVTSISWTPLNHSYATTQFYHGVPLPGGSAYFGGTQDNGTVRGTDARGPNGWTSIYGGDGGVSRVDPIDSSTMFVEYVYLALEKSLDGGYTYRSAINGITEDPNNFPFISYYQFDPNNSLRMYMGATQLWRTEDGANNWTAASAVIPKVGTVNDTIVRVEVSPADPNLVLFGTNHGYIYRNANALAADGNTVWTGTRPRSGNSNVSAIAFDPSNPSTVYATYTTFKSTTADNHIYRSTDSGVTWTGIDGSGATGLPDVPVDTILVDPDDSTRLYVGTDLGVFASFDAGNTWVRDDNPFANVITTNLVIDRTGGAKYLYAFTYGRGVYRVPLAGGATNPCTYSVSPASLTLDATGGAVSADVSTAPGCAWSALTTYAGSNSNLITVQAPGSGVGPGKAFFTAPPNTGGSHSAAFMVQGQTVSVVQAGPTSANAGDEPASAQAISSLPYQVVGTNSLLSSNPADPVHSCTGSADFKTGWWSFTAAATGSVQVSAEGANGANDSGIVISAYPYIGLSAATELACTAVPKKAGAHTFGTTNFSVTAGTKYAIEISALGNTAADSATVYFGVAAGASPTAGVSPSPVVLTAGQQQQFTAAIGNLANAAVRWSSSRALGFISPSGLYTSPAPLDAPVNVTVRATSLANPTLYAEAMVTVQPPPLTVNQGGVTNAASFQAGAVVPGEIITIFGSSIGPSNLATAQFADASQQTLATTVSNTQVLFDDVPAPLVYVYATQISAVVPYEVAPRQTTQMVVTRNGQKSQPMTLQVTQTAPALFTADSSGSGQAAIFNQDGLRNGPQYAAPHGSIVTLYGTGEGQTVPPGVTGLIANNVYPKPAAKVGVQIGGVDAEVDYAGSAPQEVAGVLQLNVKIPASVSPGPNPVVVTVGNASSPANVTLTVLGPDGRVGAPGYRNTGSTPVTLTVYKPDTPNTPIHVETIQPGNPNTTYVNSSIQAGSDWWVQVNSSPLRVISQVCGYVLATSTFPAYWSCTGTGDAPFPR